MSYKEVNNNFFGYEGTIGRKDYAINMLIVVSLYLILTFTNFQALAPYTKPEFLLHVLLFMVGLFKFVLVISSISMIYRRIADFSLNKGDKFKLITKRLFAFLYVLPILYFFGIKYFFDTFPSIIIFFDILTLFIILPLAIIFAFILCFVKSK